MLDRMPDPMLKLLAMMILSSASQDDPISKQKASIEAQKAALGSQRAAVRRQAHMSPDAGGAFFVTFDSAQPASAGCEPLPLLRRQTLIDQASRRAGIRPELLEAVMEQESGFRPCSVSVKGAVGLMQLMPATSAKLGVVDPFDPDQNVAGGASLLKELFDRYSGDLNRVLGAYNAGAARVDEAGGVPAIPETTSYVENILGRLLMKN
jgi:soluble lytic murein transglycosylase-like protein